MHKPPDAPTLLCEVGGEGVCDPQVHLVALEIRITKIINSDGLRAVRGSTSFAVVAYHRTENVDGMWDAEFDGHARRAREV